ncbi:double-stranded RNA-binding protein 6-like [Typha latifolia]|uniref:double-stranded RNA-binding protein 6-like n=1 Tax=Typha latifolia TaxID=4733 RepID=UPI003C2FE0B7
MYKNQLQELAQRSCFNLPSYTCIREGPDHAPRFKATVNFNGEVFESPSFCTTLRQAEHSAAEIALNALSHRGPSHSLAARILDETGVYKNLLQEVAQRVGAPLPSYTTVRSGLGHLPVFTCTVELAGIIFSGEPAKNKKQAEKNAAMAAWSSLKQLAQQAASLSAEPENNDEQEQIRIARALLNYRLKEKMAMENNPNATPFPKKFPMQPDKRSSSLQPFPSTCSKILPLIRPKSSSRTRPVSPATTDGASSSPFSQAENCSPWPQRFPAAGAAPYVPVRHFRVPCHGMAPPVTIRTSVPVFSAPPLPPPQARAHQLPHVMGHSKIRMASPVRIRPAVPVFAAPPPIPAKPVQVKEVIPANEVVPVKEVPVVPSPPIRPPIQFESASQVNVAPLALAVETPSALFASPDHVKAASILAVEETLAVVPSLPTTTDGQAKCSMNLSAIRPSVQFEASSQVKVAPLALAVETPTASILAVEKPSVVAPSPSAATDGQAKCAMNLSATDADEAAEVERLKQLEI